MRANHSKFISFLAGFFLFLTFAGCKSPPRLGAEQGLSTVRDDEGQVAADLSRPLSAEPGRVYYQVYVRAFYDGSSPPDMAGDLDGLAMKLDELSELGVNGLLLMPIFHSTGGMGYIPRDFTKIDPQYGTKESFANFMRIAHAKGFRVMLDFPLNHVSDDSKWFKRGAQKNCNPSDPGHDPNDPDNKYCDFFYFAADPCNTAPYKNWHKPWQWNETDCSAVWFPKWDFNAVYHRPEQYYATFSQSMPDLKYFDFKTRTWNEPVMALVKDAIKEWTSLGADGFRIDAAKHVVEGEDTNARAAEPRNIEIIKELLTVARQANPGVSFAGEIWADHATIEPYVGPALDMAFDFPFMHAVRDSVEKGESQPLRDVIQHFARRQDEIQLGQRIVFATNHDMSRLMTAWEDDEQKVRLAHFITLMMPFPPLLYYGEELGMHGKVKRPDATSPEEYVRTVNAYPWTGADNGGFPGSGMPEAGLPDNFREHNLAQAKADPDSMWHFIKATIALRQKFGLDNNTKLSTFRSLEDGVVAFSLSRPDTTGDGVRCRSVFVNVHPSQSQTIRLRHADETCAGGSLNVLASQGAEASGDLTARLAPYGTLVIGY